MTNNNCISWIKSSDIEPPNNEILIITTQYSINRYVLVRREGNAFVSLGGGWSTTRMPLYWARVNSPYTDKIILAEGKR